MTTKKETRPLPAGWEWVRISNVVVNDIERCDPSQKFAHTFKYIDITSVDNVAKLILSPQEIAVSEAPSRARQVVKANDILVATTRPNLNAVAIVPPELDGQICSTGFCILRAPSENLARYIFIFVQSPFFVSGVSAMVQGALYPAINDEDVKRYWMPLPPPDNLQDVLFRIEAQLTKVQRLRLEAAKQLEAINVLPNAILQEAFGEFESPAD